jgi:hypothetical protein
MKSNDGKGKTNVELKGTGQLRDSLRGFHAQFADMVADSLKKEADKIMEDAYATAEECDAYARSRGIRVPSTVDAIPMRKNADGVWIMKRRR